MASLAPWGSLLSAQPNSWPRAGLPHFPSWKESPSYNEPAPSPSLPRGSSLRTVLHPVPPTPASDPRLKPSLGLTDFLDRGGESLGRQLDSREGVWDHAECVCLCVCVCVRAHARTSGQESGPRAEEESLGKRLFQRQAIYVSMGVFLTSSDPLPSLPSQLPPLR